MGHAERDHSFLSASGAHRWLACTPSAMLEKDFPDTTSESAREGTLAHELAELKVRNYFYSVEFGKRKLTAAIKKLKEQELWQDEMMGHTDTYLDVIKTLALGLPSKPYVAIEKRVDFSTYVPDGFGTADCILLQGDTLHVIDFKYGKGIPVSAEENPQMKLYALGAYETYKILYPIKNIHLVIVQPRLPDGTSEWSCDIDHLLRFGEYVKARAELAIKGEGPLSPGEKQCRFCRARAKCRARAEENVRLAFAVGKKPPLISNEEVGKYLQMGEDVAKWLKDLQEYALSECLAGKDIPGWKAVEGRGAREWTDMDAAFEKLVSDGVVEGPLLWEKKPLTLAQVEKLVGVKEFKNAVGDLVVKAPGKPTLVKESDKREAITNKMTAEKAFKEEK
ncbi:MAG: DUF2800 domain-containing protein [Blautia sp.]|nr:DUF2800 domain-containing protein [Blautia sp.]